MSYNAGIPNANDLISVSQGQIKTNFTQLNNQFAVDHTAFNTGSGNGDGHHKQLTFTTTRAAPVGLTGLQSMFYPKTVSGVAAPFFTNSATDSVLWNGGSSQGVVTSALTTTGSVVLPNGFAMIWGQSSSSAATQPITFPGTGAPGWPAGGFLTACFNVQITQTTTGATAASSPSVTSSSVSKTGFTFRTASGSINGFFWFAIGN